MFWTKAAQLLLKHKILHICKRTSPFNVTVFVLDSLMRRRFLSCAVCLFSCSCVFSSTVVWGECNHSFHNCCMSLWVKQNNRCPLCQQDWVVQRIGKWAQRPGGLCMYAPESGERQRSVTPALFSTLRLHFLVLEERDWKSLKLRRWIAEGIRSPEEMNDLCWIVWGFVTSSVCGFPFNK